MTFIEQACHRRATELWRQRPSIYDWRGRIFFHLLRYCEVSGGRPTSSASIVLFRSIAAVGAEVYRRKAPVMLDLAEPQLLKRSVTELRARAEGEVRLYQDIFARLFKLTPARMR